MLFWMTNYLAQFNSDFTVFEYLTVRGILGVLTALLISLLIGPYVIRRLNYYQIGQVIRSDGPQSHLTKSGTPTMGGVLIVISIIISSLLWSDLSNTYVWVVIFVTACFGFIGWTDDYLKVFEQNPKGLTPGWKYFWQSIIGFTAACVLYSNAVTPAETELIIPFFKDFALELGVFYIFIAYFFIVGFSNAVNLTDGLDGLASGCGAIVFTGLSIELVMRGSIEDYAIASFCMALGGAWLGFLIYNRKPAKIFMGDTGSLAMGAAFAGIALISNTLWSLLIMGGIFLAESLSVIIQVGVYKATKYTKGQGIRVFRMAPLHHHLELLEKKEIEIVQTFWLITIFLVFIALIVRSSI